MKAGSGSDSGVEAFARFGGFFLVKGPTEARHVRYAMDVAIPPLQLELRCIQRFSTYYVLRKRLIKATSSCQGHGTSHSGAVADLDLHQLLGPRCKGCRLVRKTLKSIPFPRRSMFKATADDVENRAMVLEAFLHTCTRLLITWKGCERGRKLFCVVLGKFLGVNLLQLMNHRLRAMTTLTSLDVDSESFLTQMDPQVDPIDGEQSIVTSGIESELDSEISYQVCSI
ncbi:hypothetical protein Poli38472_009455 [Pythium oligandrum]|uniref:Uncharacterized protein n=1 Tax=Pythium oligandrum TaxID=41045 RepID=A0A8K1CGZ1_PYTOL|nr:hypothetical protein Poli38472_009455 [Pythium oligandrum]|eukprot:TMW61962.1 hypothetical protein Poli38472_009455 [Pythium oligandrum]